MLNARTKTVIFALLLMFSSTQIVHADAKLYQYDGKLPFVQMMLNMMVAMGILDRLPSNGRYGMSTYPSSFGPSSPWSMPAMNGTGWGSPNWGVLPVESYTTNNYSPYGYAPYNSLQANIHWSSDELNGWVNEPWETSAWNPKADASGAGRQSPLAKLTYPEKPSVGRAANQPRQQFALNKRVNQKPKIKYRQKPCITDFCGLKKPNLNGLWVAQNGETGYIKIQNEYLLANVDGHERLMRFKYKLAGNHLLTMQPDGEIRKFTRMRTGQYYDR
jgi:hypothetical protein